MADQSATQNSEERRVDGGIKRKTELKDVQNAVDSTAGKEAEVMEWWTEKTAVILHYLKCNLLKIGIPRDNTVEAIKDSITRGNMHEFAREKCWKHILVELSDIAGLQVSDVMFAGEESDAVKTVALVFKSVETSDSANDPILFEGEERCNEQGGNKIDGREASPQSTEKWTETDSECLTSRSEKVTYANSSGRNTVHRKDRASTSLMNESQTEKPDTTTTNSKANVDLKAMTMMERQVHWMKKKAEKAEQKRAELDNKELADVTFRPKINSTGVGSTTSTNCASNQRRSSSVSRTNVNSNELLRLQQEITALKAENLVLKRDARDSRRSSSKSTRSSKNGANSSTPSKRRSISSKKPGCGPETEDASNANASLSQKDQDRLHYLAEMARERTARKLAKASSIKKKPVSESKVKNKAAEVDMDASTSSVLSNQMDDPTNGLQSSLSNGILKEIDANVEPVSSLKLPSISSKPKRANSFAFDTNSTSDQGKFKIRDSDAFHLNSLFKKRDTGMGCQPQRGVSVVMGIREDNGRQQALSLIFNRDLFDEEKAGQWWEENQHRFLSPTKTA
jgi:hypothetical protein